MNRIDAFFLFLWYVFVFWMMPVIGPGDYLGGVLIFHMFLVVGLIIFFIFWAIVEIYEKRKGR